MKQQILGYLTQKEKTCTCGRQREEFEEVEVANDGNIAVKFTSCPKCKKILVLDAVRTSEISK